MSTLTELQDELDRTNKAIDKVLDHGQQYQIGGRLLIRANLTSLYRRKRELERQIARKKRGGIATGYVVPKS